MLKWTITTITGFLVTVAMIWGIALATNLYYLEYYSYDAKIARVYSIYDQIITATGQTQNALPLFVLKIRDAYSLRILRRHLMLSQF